MAMKKKKKATRRKKYTTPPRPKLTKGPCEVVTVDIDPRAPRFGVQADWMPNDILQDTINKRIKDGWELVGTIPVLSGETYGGGAPCYSVVKKVQLIFIKEDA